MPDLKARVLVLDDDPLALELYSRELGEDYEVMTSNSVPAARQLLKDLALDVLIVEPLVDGGEGWALLKEIKHANPRPSVVLCTVEDDCSAGREQGACAFLVKPVLPVTLHALVDQIVAR